VNISKLVQVSTAVVYCTTVCH